MGERERQRGGRCPAPWRPVLAACTVLALVAACSGGAGSGAGSATADPAPDTGAAGATPDTGTAGPHTGVGPATASPAPDPRAGLATASPAPDPRAGLATASPAPDTRRSETPAADRWEVVPPEEAGLAPDLPERVEAALADRPGVEAVLIARGGRLAVEFERGGPAHANVFSVTKSVLGTLAGIALGEGALSLDTRVGDVLGDHLPDGAGARVRDLRVEDLLAMTAGLPGDLALPPPPPDGGWVAHALAQPLGPPGRFTYSSTTSHVLGATVAEATGTDLLSYARERLFTPLGIDTTDAHTPALTGVLPGQAEQEPYQEAGFAWPTDPDGLHLGYCCLKLTARDMLTFGQLWLQEGRWAGRQLVPEAFVEAATSPDGDGYGYHWWVGREGEHEAFHAAGLGGQVIEVVPDLDLVVVVVSRDLTGTGSRALVREVVLPAVR